MTQNTSSPQPSARALELLDEVGSRLRATAEEVVPWFIDQMPRRYLQDTDHATQLGHLLAILAARAAGMPLRLTLKNADESEWTFIHEQDHPGLLAELMNQLPRGRTLRWAKIHTTADAGLVLDVFRFGGRGVRHDPADPGQRAKREAFLAYAEAEPARRGAVTAHGPDAIALSRFIDACSADYVNTVTPYRLVSSYTTCRALFGTDDTVLALDAEDTPDTWRITYATGNADPSDTLRRISTELARARLDVLRAYLDVFDDAGVDGAAGGAGNRSVLLLACVVRPVGDERMGPSTPLWRRLHQDLTRIKWVDDRALALTRDLPPLGLARAELLAALGHLIHPSLARENPYVYTKERIWRACVRQADITISILDLFLAAFDPAGALTRPVLDQAIEGMVLRIEREVDEQAARRVLTQLLLSIQSTHYTNVHLEGRYALALRFNPTYLNQPRPGDEPYGAFFVHGRAFNGFHVRFRDIARGGVRVVVPSGPEQHALESERLWSEVYDLAYAQQLKNKDIPEGGAKAVLLVEPPRTAEARVGAVNRAVVAFADSLLDLITPDPAIAARVVHRTGRPRQTERLYLGPDENISPALIEWVVGRAHRRGYPNPDAFMSSKPGAGINHKQYGVTSEGVTVFLEEALREIGINPRVHPFTVKLTGGPDGDVAGNEIVILAREFPHTAHVVGIADGSGGAEDPEGLDLEELIRLFRAGLPIAHFDRSRLGPTGALYTIDQPGGVKLRNSMHNRVESDAFVPAGGRPETINEANWREFLRDGEPTSRVIVEGANLFITPGARQALSEEAGVIIVKDSSANKCGVICSSYEIAASMLLSSEQFMAVKEQFVIEVVTKLRALARREARLLFRERRHDPSLSLAELSIRASRIIIRASDAIERALMTAAPAERELLHSLVGEYLPPVLVETAGPAALEGLPPQYLSSLISAALATKIVYREGLDFLAHLDEDSLASLALRYLRKEREVATLIAAVSASDLPDRDRIASLLRRGGTRASLD